MADHIRDVRQGTQAEPIDDFDYNYPWAAAPDIIRSHQKDAYFQNILLHKLSSVIRSIYGARAAHKWDTEARAFTEILYLGLTTFLGNRTLGEEYTDIQQVSDSSHRLPSLLRRSGYILSAVLAPYALNRILPPFRRKLRAKLEGSLRKHQRNNSDSLGAKATSQTLATRGQIQEYILTHLDTITSPQLIHAVSLATFYFTGAYYHLSKRLLGLRYIFTRKVEASDQRVGYEVLGVLLVLQMSVQAYLHVQSTYQKYGSPAETGTVAMSAAYADEDGEEPSIAAPLLVDAEIPKDRDTNKHKQHLASITNTIPPPSGVRYDLADAEIMKWIPEGQQRKCTLCLEPMRDPSSTTCGHVFCWSCVTDWLREQPMCPLCRQSALVQHVLPLQG